MSELLSMLVPLHTLPGWPEVPNPPVLEFLGLLFGLPLLFGIIVTLLAHARSLARAGRGETADLAGEPLWLGAGSAEAKPAELESSSAADAGAEVLPQHIEVGGASARW